MLVACTRRADKCVELSETSTAETFIQKCFTHTLLHYKLLRPRGADRCVELSDTSMDKMFIHKCSIHTLLHY